ncbi:hypothetical protein GPK34_00085 [Secundilactobacillus kimchicus]|uniref:hypothetical protein n=1 Tax=Secundilactobacillus kimchicus TaxID=528209 RepID=UPI001C00C5C7|nr:hypothetical protein [Secundilactobacillus kimchicus]MBT9670434.1 hypothetical protein [Secundilactobacillus kimchicus]
MSLRDLATAGLDGFDAKHDAVSAPQGLPAGDYTMSVSDIDHRVFKSGWDAFGVTFEVVEGENVGRKENVNLSFAETTKTGKAIPEFVLDRNIKLVAKLGAMMNIDITGEDFAAENETDIHDHLAQKLRPGLGTIVILKIIETPNKKHPENGPFRNYDLQETEQPDELNVDDQELPSNVTDPVAEKADALDPDPFANNATTPASDDTDLPFD